MGVGWEDCDTALKTWVSKACSQLQSELGDQHVGTYLHGSLAAGSFYPPKSDVDILFVIRRVLDPEARRRLAVLAAVNNAERPITGSLECSVVCLGALAPPVHPMRYEVHFSEGMADDILAGQIDYRQDRNDPDLVAHVQAVSEFGVALTGPPVSEVFAAPARVDFVDSILGELDWILENENILESPFYGVLNIARIFWVLEKVSTRLVPSKEEAGEWLIRSVPEQHQAIVRLALDVYRDPALVSSDERKTGGKSWPNEALLGFRDWARERLASSQS